MTKLENIYDGKGDEVSEAIAQTEKSTLHVKKQDLYKIKRKIKKLRTKLDKDFYYLDNRKVKKIKRKIRRYKKERSQLQSQISDIEERLSKTEESISLIIPEVLKMRSFYRQQIIQKLLDCNTLKEAESCLKLLEGGRNSGKKL